MNLGTTIFFNRITNITVHNLLAKNGIKQFSHSTILFSWVCMLGGVWNYTLLILVAEHCIRIDCCLKIPHGMGTTWATFFCNLLPTCDANSRNYNIQLFIHLIFKLLPKIHQIWTMSPDFGWMCLLLYEICIIIHVWLHHFNNFRQCDNLQIWRTKVHWY